MKLKKSASGHFTVQLRTLAPEWYFRSGAHVSRLLAGTYHLPELDGEVKLRSGVNGDDDTPEEREARPIYWREIIISPSFNPDSLPKVSDFDRPLSEDEQANVIALRNSLGEFSVSVDGPVATLRLQEDLFDAIFQHCDRLEKVTFLASAASPKMFEGADYPRRRYPTFMQWCGFVMRCHLTARETKFDLAPYQRAAPDYSLIIISD